MKTEHRSLNDLPVLVRQILFLNEAYLVGSACEWFLNKELLDPRDFDVMVEPDYYMRACQLVSNKSFKINSFGGIKIIEDVPIDIWPMSLSYYIKALRGDVAIRFNPFKVIRW